MGDEDGAEPAQVDSRIKQLVESASSSIKQQQIRTNLHQR